MLVHHVEVQKTEDMWKAHYADQAAAAKPTATKVVNAVWAWVKNVMPVGPMPELSPSWAVA